MSAPARPGPVPAWGPIGALGAAVTASAEVLGSCVLLWGQTVRLVRAGRISLGATLRQADAVGVGSLPMAALTCVFTSAVLCLYVTDLFSRYGFNEFIGMLMGQVVVREMGPLLTAIVVASREGSRIAAELAAMKVTEQLDALRSLATDPVEYLVVPRYLGGLLAMPLLSLLSSMAGVAGAYPVAAARGVSSDVYWGSVMRGVSVSHVGGGLVKALLFGAIITIVASRTGLHTGFGAAAVGRSVTASVVLCILLVHIADFGLALVFA